MTQPDDSPQVFEGTDIVVDPESLEDAEAPATTDPEEQTDDGTEGGVAGQGGAG